MTERAPRAKRWSRSRVRALAWTTGLATFLAGIGVLGAAPMPDQPARASGDRWVPRPRVIVRRITRRVVIVEPATPAPVTYVPAPVTVSTGSSGSVAAPPSAPPATGGS
ncbi:MAG: hypothetical protein ACXWZF_00745 [Actinomycetota bacterium]